MKTFTSIRGTAVLSARGTYRYILRRYIEHAHGRKRFVILWVMVNPSTADAFNNDPTIRKVIEFTKRMGGTEAVVVNKFAYRAKDVKELRTALDPVGPANAMWMRKAIKEADQIIVAWGSLNKLPKHLRTEHKKVSALLTEFGKTPLCLELTKDGDPSHPVMLGYEREILPWPGYGD